MTFRMYSKLTSSAADGVEAAAGDPTLEGVVGVDTVPEGEFSVLTFSVRDEGQYPAGFRCRSRSAAED